MIYLKEKKMAIEDGPRQIQIEREMDLSKENFRGDIEVPKTAYIELIRSHNINNTWFL